MPTRRLILLGGLGVGGALVVGYALWPSGLRSRADALAAKPGERFVTNWLKIDKDGIATVMVPHQDMGTGTLTALAQMAAEELDADWSKVRAEQAPADPVFANGALLEGFALSGALGGPFDLAPADIPGPLRGLTANGFRLLAEQENFQITGGSAAVRFTGVYCMRVTGAAARHMLIAAASARWNVSPQDCTARLSRVIHIPTGRSFGYGELVEAAAAYNAPANPPLKPRSAFTLVGTSLPRADVAPKTNGTAVYGIDVKVPEMHYGAITICPVFGGSLADVDQQPLRGRRGITAVVKLKDAVVVVADRFWRAKDGVAALQPQWNDGGNGSLTSAQISQQRRQAIRSGPFIDDVSQGDEGASGAGTPITATYEVPYLAHATMEPVNATAWFKSDGTLEMWSGVQDGLGARAFCAKAAGLALEQVQFHVTKLGGGFGRRLPGAFNYLTYAVQTAQAMPGVPVKLIFTREQDIQHDFYRPNVVSQFAATLDHTGMPQSWSNRYTTEDKANREAHPPYAVANQKIQAVKMTTPVPTGYWRSVEASWHGFFIESFIDELAHHAGQDPVAYRLALLKDRPRHAAVLSRAAQLAAWGTKLPPGHGRGVALVEAFQTIVAEVVELSVTAGGQVQVQRVTAVADAGTVVNPANLKAQIEGAVIFGLSAMNGSITIDKGAVVQSNFPDYPVLGLSDCPPIAVHLIDSDGPYGGGGEPGTPPILPALTNAIFAATGIRIRTLPVDPAALKPQTAAPG